MQTLYFQKRPSSEVPDEHRFWGSLFNWLQGWMHVSPRSYSTCYQGESMLSLGLTPRPKPQCWCHGSIIGMPLSTLTSRRNSMWDMAVTRAKCFPCSCDCTNHKFQCCKISQSKSLCLCSMQIHGCLQQSTVQKQLFLNSAFNFPYAMDCPQLSSFRQLTVARQLRPVIWALGWTSPFLRATPRVTQLFADRRSKPCGPTRLWALGEQRLWLILFCTCRTVSRTQQLLHPVWSGFP